MKNWRKWLNRETVLYLVCGVATTAVNYIVFWLCYEVAFEGAKSLTANGIAFGAAVVFAYIVNKMYVFESKSWSWAVLRKEVPAFLVARVGSFGLEELGLWVAEHMLGLNGVVLLRFAGVEIDGILGAKLALAVIVVLVNYVFCKWLVFRKEK